MKIPTIGVLVSVLCGSCLGQDKQTEYGFGSGKSMPFHVVDFVAGARTEGAGCPSVMISNRRSRGIEIWSKSQAGGAVELAAALDGKLRDDHRARVFLVHFNGDSRKSYTASSPEQSLKNIIVAVPRSSRTALVFDKADESHDSGVIVFFMDRKVIKSRLRFKQAELAPDDIQALVETADKFLAGE